MTRLVARLFFGALLSAHSTTAAGQSTGRPIVRVEVTDTTGAAIRGARISVRETGASVRSDSTGVALLKDLPRSALNLSINRLGFQPAELVLAADSQRLRVSLQPRP